MLLTKLCIFNAWITLAGCRLNVLLHHEKQACSGKNFVRFLLSTLECHWISAPLLSRRVVFPVGPFFTLKHLLKVSDVLRSTTLKVLWHKTSAAP